MNLMRSGYFRSVASAAIMAFSAVPIAARAQSASDPTLQSNNNSQLGEIVVTARKKSETVLAAPLAITAIDANTIHDADITSYTSLEKFTPGFHWVEAPERSFNTLIIRGVFPASNVPERSAAQAFIDGVPTAGGAIPGFNDIQRVEVVNGPQSAYFGRATFAGAVNFITRSPTADPHANVDLDYGMFNTVDLTGAVEGPLAPGVLTARIGFREYHTDGAFANYGYGGRLGEKNTQSVSFVYNFTPISQLTIRGFVTAWQDTDGANPRATIAEKSYNCNPKTPGGPLTYICGGIGSISDSQIAYDNTTPSRLNAITAVEDPKLDFFSRYGFQRKAIQVTQSVAYELPADFNLNANFGFGDNQWGTVLDQSNQYPEPTPSQYYYAKAAYDTRDFTGEVRLTSPQSWPVKLMIGATYSHRTDQTDTELDSSGFAFTVVSPTVFGYNNTGVFGSVSYNFTDKLSITGEGRYQNDDIIQHVLTPTGLNLSASTKSFTPRVILQYKITPSIQAYASYAEGTRPAQLNTILYSATPVAQAAIQAQANVPLLVPEEKLAMEEIGLKGVFLDNRLRLLTAFYYGEWTNRQITQGLTITVPVTNTYTVVLPGGQVQLAGVELQGSYKFTDNLTLQGNWSYSGTDIQKTNCVECGVITGNLHPNGDRLPQYPAYAGAISAIYERDLTQAYKFYGRMDYSYTGRQFDTEANTAWIDASSKVDMRVGLRRSNLSGELYVTNLFDSTVPVGFTRSTDPFIAANYSLVLIPSQPRIVGIRLSAKY